MNIESRNKITKCFGNAVNSLVQELYSEKIDGYRDTQEADITSQLSRRLMDTLDNKQVGDYVFRVIAKPMPDRGPNSMEKLTGADLFMTVSLEGQDGFDKGLFIQAKYDQNINRADLKTACSKMAANVGNKGAYVWIYERSGIKVISAKQVEQMQHNNLKDVKPRSAEGFFGRILDCYAGSKKWGISSKGDRRETMNKKLRELRPRNGIDIQLKKQNS